MGIVLPEGVFNNPSLAYVREFCEDRASIRAVVSLPQETFYSSGASVKASLLFMQRFTEEEKADFDEKYTQARAEVETKYASEIEKEKARLEAEIDEAGKAREREKRHALRKQLNEYLKAMDERKKREARALLKERFNYPIFMYEAEKVGISPTGEPDENELYSNANVPAGIEKPCLELYHEFRRNPEAFMLEASV